MNTAAKDNVTIIQNNNSKPPMKRHGDPLTENELKNKTFKYIPENTKQHSNWAFNAFNDWRKSRIERTIMDSSTINVYKEPQEMDKLDLNFLLKYFVHEVRKQNGEKYPRESIKQLIAGLQYYFRITYGKNFSIFTDEEFADTRLALDTAMKETTLEGNGLQKKRASAISFEEEKKLWDQNILGDDNPSRLNRTLLYLLGINAGLRGGDELRNLTVGHNGSIGLEIDSKTGEEFLFYRETVSKTFK